MKAIITLSESKRFVELEKTIERGKKTFVEVGTALAEIRDGKLFRSDFDSFEEYCKDKWGWNRAYAGKLIESAEVVKSLPEIVSHGIQNERQARELAKVEPEQRAAVITKAQAKADSEQRALTARDISEASEPTTVVVEAVDERFKQKFANILYPIKVFVDEHRGEPGVLNHCAETLEKVAKLVREGAKR